MGASVCLYVYAYEGKSLPLEMQWEKQYISPNEKQIIFVHEKRK